MATLNLYGIEVQAEDWQWLKKITDVLVMCTMSDVPKSQAQMQCVYIAANARRQAQLLRPAKKLVAKKLVAKKHANKHEKQPMADWDHVCQGIGCRVAGCSAQQVLP
jgi:hypothetical protein